MLSKDSARWQVSETHTACLSPPSPLFIGQPSKTGPEHRNRAQNPANCYRGLKAPPPPPGKMVTSPSIVLTANDVHVFYKIQVDVHHAIVLMYFQYNAISEIQYLNPAPVL